MSWYNTIVLSFNAAEFEDERDELNHDCAMLRAINDWLTARHCEPLVDMNPAHNRILGSNAVLFGGCYNWLDLDGLIRCIGQQPWKHASDVQVLFWDDNATKWTCAAPTGRRN